MKLVFATHNPNKLAEIKAIMPAHIELLSLTDIGCTEDIEEYGKTIEENAIIKTQYVYDTYKLNCFADDTGLEVIALNGEPGVYSARYAGEHKNAEDNMDKLLHKLEGKNDRSARFKTVIALCMNGTQHTFDGVVNGLITHQKRGVGGFGYDPVFQPEGASLTFAEMAPEEKNKMSHRARATEKLLHFLKNTK